MTSLAARLAAGMEGTQRADRLQKAYESLKATQEQLVCSERLKVIGQMAAGVAHDFNNVLSIIMARAEYLHRKLEHEPSDTARLHKDLSAIVKAAEHGAETIRRIQNYTRIRKDEPSAAVDLNAALRDAIEISKPKWKGEPEARGREIEVYFDLGEIAPVTGNVHELVQVVENLIFNAVDAMPDGGRIALKTTEEDGTVVLEVSDSGVGMDSRTQIRLFEPFFTTKPDGQGLGTSIIYGIVTRHKGRISVQSMVGVGTTFRITLPAYAGDSQVADEVRDLGGVPLGAGCSR
jgi:signal transduction histidine kinase